MSCELIEKENTQAHKHHDDVQMLLDLLSCPVGVRGKSWCA